MLCLDHSLPPPPPPHPWLVRGGSTRELWAGLMGRMGLTNLRWEPTAAGKGGAECVAAARLMRAIQEVISLAVLWAKEVVCLQGFPIPITCSTPPLASHLCCLPKPETQL